MKLHLKAVTKRANHLQIFGIIPPNLSIRRIRRQMRHIRDRFAIRYLQFWSSIRIAMPVRQLNIKYINSHCLLITRSFVYVLIYAAAIILLFS